MFRSLNPRAVGMSVPFDQALTLAADNGFEGLDFEIRELLDLEAHSNHDELKARFTAAGLQAGAWSLPLRYSAEEADFKASLAELPRAAALAQAVGSKWCSTVVMPFSDTLPYAENMAFHLERLRPVAKILADHGCGLGLEFIGPKHLRDAHRYPFMYTIKEALDLGAQIGTGNVGLLLDCFHWYTSGGSVDDLQALRATDIIYVHVNDGVAGRSAEEQQDLERELPGATGVIEIGTFMRAVAATGYDGPVAVEPFSPRVSALPPAECARVVKESLDRIWV